MKRFISAFIIIILISSVILSPAGFVFAQSKTDTQIQLEQELKEIQSQIDEYSKVLAKTVSEKKTLQNKIKQLQTKQKALQLQIKESTLKLYALEDKIVVTEKGIKKNKLKEDELNNAVASAIRRMNQIDNNFLVALITAEGFSSFLNEIHGYAVVSDALGNLRAETKNLRVKLEEQNVQLEDQKNDTVNILQIKSIQQQGLIGTIGEQNNVLEETKGKESEYQAALSDTKARAAEIRNRIYELFDVGKQITFGQAVEIAKWAAGITGARPAFLLAILTQESNLGKNVGTCNRLGDPPEKSWKVIMKPDRDQEPFKAITAELGLDPDITPVSCPMRDRKGKQVGWGGAMGPAQFIPSTWLGWKSKVSSYTGKAVADPWDIRDAFLASALKLKSNGADGTDAGEWKAAMIYFSGSTNVKNRFYGDNVIATTRQYLQDIADLR
ncbi:MAG: hypothetical protein WC725_04105 [Patescibacteria group bacterium]|jgi:peptidoglycan hydrolase CwlO-like protein